MKKFNYTERSRKFSYRHPFLASLGIHINFWVISFTLLILIRHYILRSVNEVVELPIPLHLPSELVEGLFLSVIYAVLLTIVNYQLDRRLSGYSIGSEILIRSVSYFLIFLIIWSVGSYYFQNIITEGVQLPENAIRYQFYVMLIYTLVSSVLFGFITQVNKSYGPGVLVPILLGYYRKPVREYRIFLFADLRSSTTYAEKLGMYKYSSLIQECFRIANQILPKHDAQIYQYVGDEIVLVWQAYQEQDFVNALNYYFHFQDELDRRKAYFEQNFGVTPTFKAGINCGEITVVEVGNIKRDIAYHGDNINIAARLESLGSGLDVPVLLSEGFYNLVKHRTEFTFGFVDEIQLKGKLKKTNVYTVSKAGDQ